MSSRIQNQSPSQSPQKNKRITYKFSISNLVLVNEVYPFDFFLRVRPFSSLSSSTVSPLSTSQAQQKQKQKQKPYQDSPIIQENSMECDEVFPWEFGLKEVRARVQFVELTKSTKIEIVRAKFQVESVTDDDGETVAMIGNRNGKKLCIVTYKMEPYTVMKEILKNSNENKNRKKNSFNQQDFQQPSSTNQPKSPTKTPSASPSPRKPAVTFTKQQHEQLSRQIAHINKNIDKILENQKNQHNIFNKYLDESTSFIKQIMNQSQSQSRVKEKQKDKDKDKQKQLKKQPSNCNILKQVQEQNQNQQATYSKMSNKEQAEDEKIVPSRNWYQFNYGKEKPRILKNFRFCREGYKGNDKINGKQEEIIEYGANIDLDKINQTILISEVAFNLQLKPSYIKFNRPSTQFLDYLNNRLSQQQKQNKNISNTSINLSISQISLSKPELISPLLKICSQNPSSQFKKSFQLPYLSYCVSSSPSSSSLSPIPILLLAIGIPQKQKQKPKQLYGCLSNQQIINQKVQLYDEKGQCKGIMKFRGKFCGNFCGQTQEMLGEVDKNQKQENQQKQKEKEKENQIIKKQQQRYQLQKSQKPSSKNENKRNSRIRRLSTSSPAPSLRNQLENRQTNPNQKQPSSNKKLQVISNQISASYFPHQKHNKDFDNESVRSNKNLSKKHNSLYLSQRSELGLDDEPNQNDVNQPSQPSSSQYLPKLNLITLKIDTVSIKLSSPSSSLPFSFSQYIGKYIKLSIRNKQPHITQIINLSTNLTWNCKACIFQNVSPFAQLGIEFCHDQSQMTIVSGDGREKGEQGGRNGNVIGKCKICLALLDLEDKGKGERRGDKVNRVKFYHQYIRDQHMQVIGQVIIGYQNIDKAKKLHQSRSKPPKTDGLQQPATIRPEKLSKSRSKSNPKSPFKSKPTPSQPTNRTKKYPQIGNESSNPKLISSTNPIRSKKYKQKYKEKQKYTGGNIIIGRAPRWKNQDEYEYVQVGVKEGPEGKEREKRPKPGPGDYDLPSGFEKYN